MMAVTRIVVTASAVSLCAASAVAQTGLARRVTLSYLGHHMGVVPSVAPGAADPTVTIDVSGKTVWKGLRPCVCQPGSPVCRSSRPESPPRATRRRQPDLTGS